MKAEKCRWIYAVLSLGLLASFALGLPGFSAEQEWVDQCRIQERPIWPKARTQVNLFAKSSLPEVVTLAGEIQAILKKYGVLQKNVPGMEKDCLALIKEGVRIANLNRNLQKEGAEYNRQCSHQPKNERCIQWYRSLLKKKESIVQQKNKYENQKTLHYSRLSKYEKSLDGLTTQVKAKLLIACKKERQNLEKALEEKRRQVKGTQEALRRLGKSIRTGSEELADWKKTTEEATSSAWKQGQEMLINNLGDMIGVLSGDPEKWGGKDAVEVLESQLKDPEIKKVVKDLKHAKEAVENLHGSSELLEPTLENAYAKLTEALGNAEVQKMLKIGGQYTKYATYLKSIVDSSYNITAEICAWQRISQMDRNSEKYLKAVEKLDGRMKEKVAEINEIKAKLKKLQCGPHSRRE